VIALRTVCQSTVEKGRGRSCSPHSFINLFPSPFPNFFETSTPLLPPTATTTWTRFPPTKFPSPSDPFCPSLFLGPFFPYQGLRAHSTLTEPRSNNSSSSARREHPGSSPQGLRYAARSPGGQENWSSSWFFGSRGSIGLKFCLPSSACSHHRHSSSLSLHLRYREIPLYPVRRPVRREISEPSLS
jgi:hypothetical protein